MPMTMRIYETIGEVTNLGKPVKIRAAARLVAKLDNKITHID